MNIKKELRESDWFAVSAYSTAGRPKMESALFDYAKKLLLHRLIAGCDIAHALNDLSTRQDTLSSTNPRWSRTDIRISDGVDGIAWIGIGESHITLQRVEGNY